MAFPTPITRRLLSIASATALLSLLVAPLALADNSEDSFSLTLKDHRFTPQHITVPAGKKVKLVVTNADKEQEEFDSDDLHREKDLGPGETATIFIGPLKPGVYKFRGEYHPDTANGTVTAK
jgi:hypothetical protein